MPAYKDSKRGTWYVKFRYKEWTGNQKDITKRGFSTKREALQWERNFLLQKSGSTDMTFKDFVSVYFKNRTPYIKESTTCTKENIVETKILPYFGEKKLRDITSTDVMQWQGAILREVNPKTGRKYSKSYLKTIHNQLSALFNHAVKFYGLTENPARTTGNMGTDKEIEMKYWTKEEYLLFADEMMDCPQAYYCFEVLYWTGIRLGELLALTPKDINLKEKTLTVSKSFQHVNGKDLITSPKTPQSNRTIKMPQFLCDELDDYINMQYDLNPDDRLFPVTKTFLHNKMRKGCAALGVEKIRLHDLRHSHVSLLINLGYDVVSIAKRVGHT